MYVVNSPWKGDLKRGGLEVMTPLGEESGKHEHDFIWKANNLPVAPEAILAWLISCFIRRHASGGNACNNEGEN